MRRFWLALSLFLLTLQAGAAEYILRYPRHQGDDPHVPYMLDLLRLIGEKTGQPLDIRSSADVMTQGRAVRELQAGTGRIDLLWAMTSSEREQAIQPIRIPLYKGLMGWRIAIVQEAQAGLFKERRDTEIAQLVAGQLRDWPDTDILKANHFNVHVATQYDALFSMLERGRIQYFPRSLVEIWQELRVANQENLVAETHTVLHYPTAFYFFVSKQNPQLAALLERGLEAAIRDGSFDRLFLRHNRDALRQARLEERRRIELNNPYLPPETPLKRKELWYSPPAPKH